MKYTAVEYAKTLHSLAGESAASHRRETVRDFLSVVAKNGSLHLLPEIIREYSLLSDKEAGIRDVTVRTPETMPAGALAKEFSFKTRIKALRDVRLSGGAVIEIGDLRVDNSIARRLSRAREAFSK
ncbi:MAG: F0F1 ATP synthase subunit delta [Patescibacteria group bacterium]